MEVTKFTKKLANARGVYTDAKIPAPELERKDVLSESCLGLCSK